MIKANAATRFVLLAAVLSSRAAAQTEPPKALQALVASGQYQANIARLFAALPADVFQRCSRLVSSGSTVTIFRPVAFAKDGYPVSGMWRQSFPVKGCGNDTTINLFFTGQANEKVVSLIGAPGDTHADPVLQKDAAQYVMLAVRAKATTCTSPHIRTTRYDGAKTANGATRPSMPAWHETWTVSVCGRLISVGLDFIPDATGTTISAAAAVPLR